MANRYSSAAKKAADLTNKQLGEELAKFSTMNDLKIRELLPTKKDKVEFARLMELVEREASMDEQLAYLGGNIQTAGKVVFSLLKCFL